MKINAKRRLPEILLISLTVALLATTAIYAVATINTNDGSVDANWAIEPVFDDDPDADGNEYAEIDKVWITNNSEKSIFYFRVDTLMAAGNEEVMIARLDCNRNGSFTDAVDVAVIGDGYPDLSYECQGNTYDVTCWGDNRDENNGNDAFEEIVRGSGEYTYEFYGDVAGTVDWSACTGEIDVQFVAAKYNEFSVEDDLTTKKTYGGPSAVQISGFAGGSNWIAMGILLIGCLAIVSRRA